MSLDVGKWLCKLKNKNIFELPKAYDTTSIHIEVVYWWNTWIWSFLCVSTHILSVLPFFHCLLIKYFTQISICLSLMTKSWLFIINSEDLRNWKAWLWTHVIFLPNHSNDKKLHNSFSIITQMTKEPSSSFRNESSIEHVSSVNWKCK